MATLDKDTLASLAAPFDEKDIAWKPQTVTQNRALAVAYIDARTVAERLDQVVEGDWSFDWEQASNGCVKGRLTVCGIIRCDVGEQGDGPQGKTLKAAVSDALKRSAVLFGVGRYLYHLPAQWVDYDAQHKRLVHTPELPDWAKPEGAQSQSAPQPGEQQPPPPITESKKPQPVQQKAAPKPAGWEGWSKPARDRFWAKVGEMNLSREIVHKEFGVESMKEWDRSMEDANAILEILNYGLNHFDIGLEGIHKALNLNAVLPWVVAGYTVGQAKAKIDVWVAEQAVQGKEVHEQTEIPI